MTSTDNFTNYPKFLIDEGRHDGQKTEVEAIGTFNGKPVYKIRDTGYRPKKSYQFITLDGITIDDGRRIKRFSNKVTKKATPKPVKKEEPKKTTPKPVIEKKKEEPKKTTPKPVVKKNVIIKKEEQKKADEIVDKERARLKKLEPKKQTADQLEKRRLKYQENRAKELARKKAYREANKQEINAKQDAYRDTAKSKAYQKAYREANTKPKEPKPIKPIINKIIKPRKVRTDAGKERGKYNVVKPEEMKKTYPKPVRKDGESEEVYNVRRNIWDKVIRGKLKPSMLGMKSAVKVAYGNGINIGGETITPTEWMKRLEKQGQNIERDGLGVGNLGKTKIDPDEVF